MSQQILRLKYRDGAVYDPRIVLSPNPDGTDEFTLVVIDQPPLRINKGNGTLANGLRVETKKDTFETRMVALRFKQAGDYPVRVYVEDENGQYPLFDDSVSFALVITDPIPVGNDAKLVIEVPPQNGVDVSYRITEVPIA